MTEFSFCGELFKDTHIFEVQAILVSTTGKRNHNFSRNSSAYCSSLLKEE